MPENKKLLYEMQAEICHALSHPIRLQILDIVSESEKTSSELLEILDIPKANLSQHLTVLKDAGIIKTRKEGQFQYLSLAIPRIKEACGIVRGCLSDRLEEQSEMVHKLQRNLKKATK